MADITIKFYGDPTPDIQEYYGIESILSTEDEYILLGEEGQRRIIPKEGVRDIQVPPEVSFDT